MKHEVVFGDRKFEVEVIELSPMEFEVKVNGKKVVIEVRKIFELEITKVFGETKKEQKKVEKAIKAPMVGVVTKILKKEGENVKIGENVAIIEAMKMENPISSPFEGVVEKILVKPGDKVSSGDTIMILS